MRAECPPTLTEKNHAPRRAGTQDCQGVELPAPAQRLVKSLDTGARRGEAAGTPAAASGQHDRRSERQKSKSFHHCIILRKSWSHCTADGFKKVKSRNNRRYIVDP